MVHPEASVSKRPEDLKSDALTGSLAGPASSCSQVCLRLFQCGVHSLSPPQGQRDDGSVTFGFPMSFAEPLACV